MDLLLEATRRVEQDHFWFKGFRSFVRPLVEEATAGLRDPRILDCGCGTGANMVMLAEYGRPFGFDFSWDGLQFARHYGQRRLAHASIAQIPFASGSFDLVTAFDVLYSVPEDAEAEAVREIYRVLRPGGTLIVNVAALEILKGNHSVFGGELRRSRRPRLRAVLTRGGFDVRRLTYTNFTLFPIMLAVRTAHRVRGLPPLEDAGTEMMVPARPVNAALTALLQLEARALKYMDMPLGSSMLCVARKPAA